MLIIWNFIVCDEFQRFGSFKYSISCRDEYPTVLFSCLSFHILKDKIFDLMDISFLYTNTGFPYSWTIWNFFNSRFTMRFSPRGCLVGIVPTQVTWMRARPISVQRRTPKCINTGQLPQISSEKIKLWFFIFWLFYFWAHFFCFLLS